MMFAVLTIGIATLAAALAVDLGSLAVDKRSDQKVADLASLDAVRGLNDSFVAAMGRGDLTVLMPRFDRATLLASESAQRNGYDPADVSEGHKLVVALGVRDTGKPKNFRQTCPPDPADLPPVVPDCVSESVKAVKVAVSSKTGFDFTRGNQTATVSSIAFQDIAVPPPVTSTTVPPVSTTVPALVPDTASFSIGSSLVNLNTSSSALLGPIIGSMIAGDVSAVSWSGLASGGLTLGALQTELLKEGFSVGSVSELMSQDLTLAQLYIASFNALTLGGDTAHADIFKVLKAQVKVGGTLKLGNLVSIQSGTPDAAVLGTAMNLFQLVTGSAEVLNGTNTISVSNVGITVPGVSSTSLSLKVIETPQIYIGPVGGSVTTGQVTLVVTPALNLDVAVGLSLVHVTNALPVQLELAGATGKLTAAACSGTKSITVQADPKAFDGAAQVTSLHATLLGLPVLDVQTTSATASIDGSPSNLTFAYPSEFLTTTKHAGSQPIGLASLTTGTTFTSGGVTLLGVLPLGATTAQIVSAIMSALHSVIGNVDANVLAPLLTALGLDIGGADVTALALNCVVAPPATTTTTTVPPPPTTTTTTLAPPAGPPSLIG